MTTYLAFASLIVASIAVAVAVASLLLLVILTKRLDRLDVSMESLERANEAGVKEVGERISANQALLRKRIDHLEETIKKHSTRIDLVKTQLSQELAASVQKLDTRLADIAEGELIELDNTHRIDQPAPQ